MRHAMMIMALALLGSGAVQAAEFPGPKVKDAPPFNNPNVIAGGALSCNNVYSRAQLVTDKRQIIKDVTVCVSDSFGIDKDIGLQFGEPLSPYAECVVPDSYQSRPPANNPMWPVCCAVELPSGQYRMACRLFFTTK
jgi:hypothetical protein